MTTQLNWKPIKKSTRTEIWTEQSTEPLFQIIHNELTIKESEHNAKLICAAPELLRALQVAQFILSNVEYNLEYNAEHDKMINNAINKVINQ